MIKIGTCDLTGYILQNGISESTERVISASDGQSKGAHNVYALNARVPSAVNETISSYVASDSIACVVDGISFKGSITEYNANLYVEIGSVTMWNINLTIADISLSEEQEG